MARTGQKFVLNLNYAEKLRRSESYPEMTTFLKNIGSNHILQNQKLNFDWKIPFNLAAERSEAAPKGLTFTKMCAWQDSNLQPSGPQPEILSIELQAPIFNLAQNFKI